MEDIFEELAAARSDGEDDEETRTPRDDEAEEVNESRRVVKVKRTISRPRPKLDPARLLGPRGIFVLTSTFDGVHFKGKGRELDDLNNVLSRLQHWAHRLFPKMTFEDCINKIEDLGHKREIQTNMLKIRMGMVDLLGANVVETADEPPPLSPPPPVDEAFDRLITDPAPKVSTLTEEQRARMMRNRLLAEERRMARRLAREKELEEQRMVDAGGSDGPPTQPNFGECPDREESNIADSYTGNTLADNRSPRIEDVTEIPPDNVSEVAS